MYLPPHPNPLPGGEGDNRVIKYASHLGILDLVHILR